MDQNKLITDEKTENGTAAIKAEEGETSGKKRRRQKKQKQGKRRLLPAILAIIFLLAVVGVLGTALVQTNYKFSKLSAQMTYMQDTISVINSNLGNLTDEFTASQEEESSLLESYSVTLTDINFREKTYTVEVDIVPKEYNDTTETFVYFGTSEFPLELKGFYYTGSATLPIDKSYAGNMAVLFTDGERRTTEVVGGYAGIDLEGADYVSAVEGFTPEYKDGILSGKGTVELSLSGQNLFQFASAEYEVTLDGDTVYTLDLLRGTSEGLSVQSLMDENPDEGTEDEEIQSAEEEAPAVISQEEGNEADTYAILSGTYDVDFEVPIDREGNIRIQLRVSTTEGYEFIYNLFNGTVRKETEDGEISLVFTESAANHYVTFYDLHGGNYIKD